MTETSAYDLSYQRCGLLTKSLSYAWAEAGVGANSSRSSSNCKVRRLEFLRLVLRKAVYPAGE
jgi:hypothetical protein